MKLATVRTATGTTAARLTDDGWVDLGVGDLGELLAFPDWRERAAAAGTPLGPDAPEFAPVVPRPGKVLCVGLNYRTHILEMGRELPEHPTLFTKFAEALIGPRDEIQLPPESDKIDWEGELAVVIGKPVRRASAEEAEAAIAGYAVLNDVTMRDYQYRTTQWFQGKAWENSTPLGPVLATRDEIPADAEMVTRLDGEELQRTPIDDLVFGPVDLVRYISTIFTLQPGDIIATGTPGGVGHARKPARYISAGQTLSTSIDGIGELVNVAVAEQVDAAAPAVGEAARA